MQRRVGDRAGRVDRVLTRHATRRFAAQRSQQSRMAGVGSGQTDCTEVRAKKTMTDEVECRMREREIEREIRSESHVQRPFYHTFYFASDVKKEAICGSASAPPNA